MGTTMPRKGRTPIVGRREDIARQTQEDELRELEQALHREWRNRQDEPPLVGYEPDDFDEWDRRDGDE